MKTIAITLIITLIQSMMDNGLVDKIQELVHEAFDFDMTGDEKRAWVVESLKELGGLLGAAVASTAPWLINLALEALVAKEKVDD